MKGAFKGTLANGEMMIRLQPNDGSLVQDKASAIRLIKRRKAGQKHRMGDTFTNQGLKEWVLRTQAR